MKKTISLQLLLWSFASFAQESKGIAFTNGTWQEVLNEAKKTKKLIFVDIYTTWCGRL